MATTTRKDLLRRLSNISVLSSKTEASSIKTQSSSNKRSKESIKSESPSISNSKVKNLPQGSIKSESSSTTNSKLKNLPAGISLVSIPQKKTNKNLSVPKKSSISRASNAPLSKLSGVSISKTSSTPLETESNLQSLSTNQANLHDDISCQTLNQPLNPNAFLPGALKSFSKTRSQVANTKNKRKYPQFSNESLKRRASIFMAAPSQEILAQMRQEGLVKDFRVYSCRSSSEYLHCLLGYGLHQTLNFPIMGVFYLDLVRLIMKHMDRFSSDEKVKLIQVRNVCEDILYQNSTRDDFLPVEIMDEIVEKAIKDEINTHDDLELSDVIVEEAIEEQSNIQKIELKEESKNTNSAQNVSMDINRKLSKLSVNLVSKSKIEETPTRNDKRKITEEHAKRKITEEHKNAATKVLPIMSSATKTLSGITTTKNLPGISISSATKTLPGISVSSSSSKINSSSNSEIDDLERKLQEIDNQIASGRQGLGGDRKSSNKKMEYHEVTDLFSDSEDEDEDQSTVSPLKNKLKTDLDSDFEDEVSEQTEDKSTDSPLKKRVNTDLDSDDDEEPTDEQIKNISIENSSKSPQKSTVDSGLSPNVDNLINDIRNMFDKEDLKDDEQFCDDCTSFYNNKEEHNCLRKMKKQKLAEVSKFDFSKEMEELESDSDAESDDGMVDVEQTSRKLYNWSDF